MKQDGIVVITGTIYNLLFSLLIIPEDKLEKTYFFTCDSIPKVVRDNLHHMIYVPDMHHIRMLRKLKYIFRFRIFDFVLFPTLRCSKIYAQDHLPYSCYIIGKRKYSLTEDAPCLFKVNETHKYIKESWLRYENSKQNASWFNKFLNPIQGGIFGLNEICNEVVISKKTSEYIPSYIKNKEIRVVDMQSEWLCSSEEKKQFILNVFNITMDDIEMLKSRHIVVFTQPFYEDNDVPTLEDHVAVYRKVLENYNLSDVIIKTHPRETTDYQKYFPEVRVFNKPVPFQLLDLLGLRFEEAATVCSTAALSIPYPIRINWVGAKIHPSILAEYGDFIPDEIRKQ